MKYILEVFFKFITKIVVFDVGVCLLNWETENIPVITIKGILLLFVLRNNFWNYEYEISSQLSHFCLHICQIQLNL